MPGPPEIDVPGPTTGPPAPPGPWKGLSSSHYSGRRHHAARGSAQTTLHCTVLYSALHSALNSAQHCEVHCAVHFTAAVVAKYMYLGPFTGITEGPTSKSLHTSAWSSTPRIQCSTSLDSTALHWTILHFTGQYFTSLDSSTLHWTVLHFTG